MDDLPQDGTPQDGTPQDGTPQDRTPLDRAHAAMMTAPRDDAARVAFYDCLADTEIVLLLATEAGTDRVQPTVVALGDTRYVVIFDSEARLAAFSGTVSDYAALSGRGLAEMLKGSGIGVALNPDVAPSAFLIPAEAVDWLAATLAQAPREGLGQIADMAAPGPVPRALVEALTRKLRGAGGLAEAAWLVAVTYVDGHRGHLLAFVSALPDAQPGLAAAANEALTFSGIEAGAMDVTFVEAGTRMAARLARTGLALELTRPVMPDGPQAPGMDPDRPPRLR